jgi:alpha-ketoglutarate-dependent taurine dioxygenase
MNCLSLANVTSPGYWGRDSFARSVKVFHLPLSSTNSGQQESRPEALSYEKTASLANEVGSVVRREVMEGRGFAILAQPWTIGFQVETLVARTVALASMMGRLVGQDRGGSTVVHVADSGRKMEQGARYHETNASGSLHTDGPQLERPPDLILLSCFRQAEEGGDSLLASAVAFHHYLQVTRPDLLAALHESFHFDRRGFGAGENESTLERPVFRCSSTGVGIQYLHEYILDGHRKANIPLTSQQQESLSSLRMWLLREENIIRFRLHPGQTLVINNRRVCHGRTSFRDGNSPETLRHMLRAWVQV